MQEESYILKIFRGNPGNQYWEEVEIPLTNFANVISGLMYIRKNPVNKSGQPIEPIVWEDGCLEEVCGSCSMLINGRPRQACTAIVKKYLETTKSNTITLAPLTKFPLVRDLVVDRSQMFENLKKVRAWIDSDGAYDRGKGPLISQEKQQIMYTLSTCMTCGCCSEACPQVNKRSKFMGPAPISQARLFNAHPTGKMQRHRRLRPILEEGGIAECGNAQNCEQVCPKNIPLLDSIASVGRDANLQALRDIFSFHDRD